tara:strand:- start:15690 stop:16523 length:834 start_codon:yes stop_codon:yes gene_type:complete
MKKILFLLAISSVAQANELNNLIDTSSAIVDQIDRGVKLVGAGQEFAYTGTGLSDGTLSQSAHISTEQLEAYNMALSGMGTYLPYGSIQNVLQNQASEELDLMNDAVDTFTEVVVDMIQVVQVAEMAETASTPDEEASVQDFVVANQEVLTITQEEVDTYNQSVDEIETHANNASAFIAVAANTEAVEFLQQGAENNNTTAEQATVTYSSSNQWVQASWANTNNASAVYLNGIGSFGLDMYMSESDILAVGSESEFYLDSPMTHNHNCYMYGDCVEY